MHKPLFSVLFVLCSQAPVVHAHASPLECIAANERGGAKKARGELSAAREEYLACAVEACPKIIRDECGGLVASLDASIPTVILVARDQQGNDAQHVSVFFDGQAHAAGVDGRAFPVDPGQHVFRFESPGSKSREVHVVVREGEKNRTILAQLSAERPPPRADSAAPTELRAVPLTRPVPPLVYVLGAVGLGALGSFTYFAVRGRAQQTDLEQRCAPNCRPEEASAMRSKYLAADVSLAAAALSLGGATYFYLSRPRVEERSSARSPTDSLSAGVELHFGGTF